MRTLKRNKQKVWYVLYQGKEEILTTNGLRTGNWKVSYSEPSFLYANIAPATGNAETEPFGANINYSHIMIVQGTDCPIDENSLLYVGDHDPEYWGDEMDKVMLVVRVAKSLNHTRYALREVSYEFNNNSNVCEEPSQNQGGS